MRTTGRILAMVAGAIAVVLGTQAAASAATAIEYGLIAAFIS
jgi:hypothetical protein